MPRDCTTDIAGCIDCPAIAPTPARAPQVIAHPVLGWNSGAVSIETQAGDCYFEVTVGPVGAAYVGFATQREHVEDPLTVEHGFYVATLAGALLAAPCERGETVAAARAISSDTVLRAERVRDGVQYLIDGAVVHVSTRRSTGAVSLKTQLYASGDTIRSAVFAPIETYDAIGRVAGRMSLAVRGYERGAVAAGRLPLRGSGRPFARASLRLPLSGFAAAGSIARGRLQLSVRARALATVPLNYSLGGRLPLRTSGVGSVHVHGNAAGRLGFTVLAAAGSIARGRLLIGGYARQLPAIVSYVNVLQSPGVMRMTLGTPRDRLMDTLALAATPMTKLVQRLQDALALADPPGSVMQVLATLRDSVDFVDQLSSIWRLVLAESLSLAAAGDAVLESAERVADVLRLLAGPGSALAARNIVAEALALDGVLATVVREQLSDTAAFEERFAAHVVATAQALDTLLLADVPAGHVVLSAAVADSLRLDDTTSGAAEFFARLQDTVGFSVTIRLGDDVFVAWVVNTETRAATQYENYPFNSFAAAGGRYFAADADGIYELGGDTDDGDAIRARFRIGLSNLGTGKEKRMPAMYWGYRASGSLVLKVISTEVTGEKVENWYALRPRGDGAPREGRTQIGRGIKSVFWDFEVANIKGADFELDSLELFPMILDRRVRGRDG